MSGGIGSGMSPRPWWVPATPSTRSLPEAVEGVAVDRGHGDHPHPAVAPDRDLDDVTRAPRPEPRVELLLRADGHAVHAQDPVALLEARARRGPDRREVADDEAVLHVHRVDAEPRPRRAARDAAGRDQLVLPGQERLDRDPEGHGRRPAEPGRGDADHLAPVADGPAAPPLPARRRRAER